MKNPKLVVGIIVGAIAFLGALIYNTMSYSQYRVEVCMEYQGRKNCRTALGASEELAVRAATDNACAMIASGMTDSMACTGSQPVSVKWLNRK
ncbi:hypothetical protein [Bryobacter aggregatus]|uniref:hypothetical protein n=1 Tax=Bryobacter aggregatus TaxID=360054 RepID=UPI0004E1F145|nr:hypothetical protein [Bryobacter aggregatus]